MDATVLAKLHTVLGKLAQNELITNLAMVYFIILIDEQNFSERIKRCYI
jgi:hypothetical protein